MTNIEEITNSMIRSMSGHDGTDFLDRVKWCSFVWGVSKIVKEIKLNLNYSSLTRQEF